MIHKDLARILSVCARELDAIEADWAVGGATAMAVHGYERQTRDIDLFIADDARDHLLRHLTDEGFSVEPIFPPSHYGVAPLRSRDPERRVDLLFPALGVECLAIMAARRARVAGQDVPVFPLAHLIAAKLLVDPAYERERFEKDAQDLRELRVRGLIDAGRVRDVLDDIGDRGAIERLNALTRPDR